MIYKRRVLKWLIVRMLKGALCLFTLAVVGLAVAWWACPFPTERLNRWPTSPRVFDAQGRTILAVVGQDDQWRMPVPTEYMSKWLIKATVAVEDQRFYEHAGIDVMAVVRAAGSNIAAGRVVSGASTLDMQLCRMMDERPRSLWAKVVESFRALQLNCIKSKGEILEVYLNVAPYGGNVRGSEAAALAYFGKTAAELSLAEAALLAGLPQSPVRYRPDRHLEAALKRQRFVLNRMAEEGMITASQLAAAMADAIVIRPATRGEYAQHAAWLGLRRRPAGGRMTVEPKVQSQLERLMDDRRRLLPCDAEQAVVVIDVANSALVGMVGSSDPADPVDGQVNGAVARRSPGSALKPFIYAAAFEAGRLNGQSIVYDVPIRRGGWTPSNFDEEFSGEVRVDEALRQSLNIPAILVAEGVGLSLCCGLLEATGVPLPAEAQSRGGLALAIGGIDVRLWDLTNAYATVARGGVRSEVRLFVDEPVRQMRALGPEVCAEISDILSSRRRRPAGMGNRLESDVPWFMWKTGTSAGRRDAWAVGHNGQYAVGVWVGRFRGTGDVGFVGAEAAEPLLTQLFDLPELRSIDDPGPAGTVAVRHPLGRPREAAEALRILSPGDGERFLALGGKTIILPRANRQGEFMWFLDGRLLPASEAGRLTLRPGRYELRCVDGNGRFAAVRFVVM